MAVHLICGGPSNLNLVFAQITRLLQDEGHAPVEAYQVEIIQSTQKFSFIHQSCSQRSIKVDAWNFFNGNVGAVDGRVVLTPNLVYTVVGRGMREHRKGAYVGIAGARAGQCFVGSDVHADLEKTIVNRLTTAIERLIHRVDGGNGIRLGLVELVAGQKCLGIFFQARAGL